MDCAWARLCPFSNFESWKAALITFFKKSLIPVDATVSHSHKLGHTILYQAGTCLLLVYWHSLILTPLSFPFLLSFLLHYIGLEIIMVFLNSHTRQQPPLAPNSADIQFVEVDQLHWYSQVFLIAIDMLWIAADPDVGYSGMGRRFLLQFCQLPQQNSNWQNGRRWQKQIKSYNIFYVAQHVVSLSFRDSLQSEKGFNPPSTTALTCAQV